METRENVAHEHERQGNDTRFANHSLPTAYKSGRSNTAIAQQQEPSSQSLDETSQRILGVFRGKHDKINSIHTSHILYLNGKNDKNTNTFRLAAEFEEF